MTKTDLDFFLKENIILSLEDFLINLLFAAFLSFVVQIFYVKYSSTLSNKYDFSKNFTTLGVATAIIITIVKSSLALSLGLVGALSIVRFRAAIKEPEELIYLFIIIAIGLGCGAGQIKIIFSGVIFTLFIIFLHSLFEKNNKNKISEVLNLAISKNQNVNEKEINLITSEINKYAKKLDLISITKSKNNTTINFDLVITNFNKLNSLTDKISKKNYKVIVARNDINSI